MLNRHFNKHAINELELIRDWNLRAAYGAFNAMKNRDGAAGHKNARLTWLAYVGGTRETHQLLGDVVLSGEDIVSKKEFPDAVVRTTRPDRPIFATPRPEWVRVNQGPPPAETGTDAGAAAATPAPAAGTDTDTDTDTGSSPEARE